MKIFLTIKNYRCFVQPIKIEIMKDFTAFVGANNAGKSAIMRFILEFRNLFKLIGGMNEWDDFLRSLRYDNVTFGAIHVLDNEEIFSNLNSDGVDIMFDFVYDKDEIARTSPNKIVFKIYRSMVWKTKISVNNEELTHFESLRIENNTLIQMNGLPGGIPLIDLSNLIGIAKSFFNSLYIGPFRNTINVGTNSNYLDIQIGEAFIKQFHDLKTGNNKKENLAISQLTQNIKKIFEFDSFEINSSTDNRELHISINGKPYKQHELGSGLMQFVLVLANAAIKNPSYILIDEPELNLHPSLQLDFLTSLASLATEGVWFSTHSIGLARSITRNVYSVIRKGDGDSIISPIEDTPRLSEFLGAMSFSAHKELGFDSVLFVEGPTEVKIFQQFLRAMSKDHKVVIMPLYGGIDENKLVEIEEVKRITENIHIIIDSEISSEDETLGFSRQAFVDGCGRLGIDIHVLRYRATENYFSDSVVKQVFGGEYRALSSYEKLKDVVPHWNKNQNWKLARATSLEEILRTDIGKFLQKI